MIAAAPAWAGVEDRCEYLRLGFEDLEKQKSAVRAEGIVAPDAAGALLREMRVLHLAMTQQIVVAQLQESHCPLPNRLPGAERYLSAALACRAVAQLPGPEAARRCDRAEWRTEE